MTKENDEDEKPNDGQDGAIRNAVEWFERVRKPVEECTDTGCPGVRPKDPLHTHGHTFPAPVFSLGGLAGSGKTRTTQWIVEAIQSATAARVAYIAPTHKAASVLRFRVGREVQTVWSTVYYTRIVYFCTLTRNEEEVFLVLCAHQTADPGVKCGCSQQFTPCSQSQYHTCDVDEKPEPAGVREHADGVVDLLLADEASMITQEHVELLRAFGIPLLLVGDPVQLPPVNKEGVAEKRMNEWISAPDVTLEQPVRQDEESVIHTLAMHVRAGRRLEPGMYSDKVGVVTIDHPDLPAFVRRFTPGRNRVLLSPLNVVRSHLNKITHEQFFPGAGVLAPGERVVALHRCTAFRLHRDATYQVAAMGLGTYVERCKETHTQAVAAHRPQDTPRVFVTNGAAATVLHVEEHPTDCRLLYVMLREDSYTPWPGLGRHYVTCVAKDQFGQQKKLTVSRRAPGGRLWDYAYCLTPWKAQGDEYDDVIVFGIADWEPDLYRRCAYVSVTRAKEHLLVVLDVGHNLPEQFFRPRIGQ